MGLSPALGWCSALRQNLVKLRTCSEQCWEQTAGYEDASSCPTVCSSSGHMPSALSQAAWADTDLTLEATSSKVLLCYFDHGTAGVSITQQQEPPAPHHKHLSAGKGMWISNPNCTFSNLLECIELLPPELCTGGSDGLNFSHSRMSSLPVSAYTCCALVN